MLHRWVKNIHWHVQGDDVSEYFSDFTDEQASSGSCCFTFRWRHTRQSNCFTIKCDKMSFAILVLHDSCFKCPVDGQCCPWCRILWTALKRVHLHTVACDLGHSFWFFFPVSHAKAHKRQGSDILMGGIRRWKVPLSHFLSLALSLSCTL